DDQMFTMIKLISRHQNTQQFGAMLPVELTNEDIINSAAYKEYYAIYSGAAPPKTKASVRNTHKVLDVSTDESDEVISWKSSDEDDDNDVDDQSEANDDQEDEDEQDDNDDDQDSDNDSDDFVHPKLNDDASHGINVGRKEGPNAEDDDEELYKDVNINLDGRDVQMTDFARAVSSILGIVDRYIDHRMNEDVKVAVQIHSDKLRDEAQVENENFLNKLDENIQKIIKEQVKVQVLKILPKIKKTVNEQLEAKVLTRSSNSSKTSYVVIADLSELKLKKILIKKMDSNKSIHRSGEQRNLFKALVDAYECDKLILDTYGDTVTLKRRHDDADEDEEPFAGSNWVYKKRREGKEPESTSAPKEKASKTTKASQHPKWFQKQMKPPTPDRAYTLTPKLLVGPTYELMKGSCKSLVELEFFFEEVYKAKTDQLDWNNPEGQQYPHNLLKPLLLIPNSRGRHVITFDHFINNDLEYLRGGAASQKYKTSVTKTKVVDYGHIKWIKDLFYGFALKRESARDVYSKRRIIPVTELQIVEWHDYKHLDWITVRKLTNLTVVECFAFNVSLRMFTRSIVIQRRVEDLQLGFESYQKKLNLTKPDTYKTDLKRKEAYTAYSNTRGFIYQNKDKQNRLMWIDELYKFSDDTLNDVRIALDDRLKGIRMKYLPQTI
nr:hypothetical protein [Tanacetum cinerariifolium]